MSFFALWCCRTSFIHLYAIHIFIAIVAHHITIPEIIFREAHHGTSHRIISVINHSCEIANIFSEIEFQWKKLYKSNWMKVHLVLLPGRMLMERFNIAHVSVSIFHPPIHNNCCNSMHGRLIIRRWNPTSSDILPRILIFAWNTRLNCFYDNVFSQNTNHIIRLKNTNNFVVHTCCTTFIVCINARAHI